MDSSTPTPHGGGHGAAGDSIVLEEEIDQNYVPSEDEVREYAKWLGMELKDDLDLFWIAKEGLKAPLPENWKPCKTVDTDEIYYFNFATGESTWDHPCDEYYRKLYEEEKKKKMTKDKAKHDKSKQQAKKDVSQLLGKDKKKKGRPAGKRPSHQPTPEHLQAVPSPSSPIFDRKPLPGIGRQPLHSSDTVDHQALGPSLAKSDKLVLAEKSPSRMQASSLVGHRLSQHLSVSVGSEEGDEKSEHHKSGCGSMKPTSTRAPARSREESTAIHDSAAVVTGLKSEHEAILRELRKEHARDLDVLEQAHSDTKHQLEADHRRDMASKKRQWAESAEAQCEKTRSTLKHELQETRAHHSREIDKLESSLLDTRVRLEKVATEREEASEAACAEKSKLEFSLAEVVEEMRSLQEAREAARKVQAMESSQCGDLRRELTRVVSELADERKHVAGLEGQLKEAKNGTAVPYTPQAAELRPEDDEGLVSKISLLEDTLAHTVRENESLRKEATRGVSAESGDGDGNASSRESKAKKLEHTGETNLKEALEETKMRLSELQKAKDLSVQDAKNAAAALVNMQEKVAAMELDNSRLVEQMTQYHGQDGSSGAAFSLPLVEVGDAGEKCRRKDLEAEKGQGTPKGTRTALLDQDVGASTKQSEIEALRADLEGARNEVTCYAADMHASEELEAQVRSELHAAQVALRESQLKVAELNGAFATADHEKKLYLATAEELRLESTRLKRDIEVVQSAAEGDTLREVTDTLVNEAKELRAQLAAMALERESLNEEVGTLKQQLVSSEGVQTAERGMFDSSLASEQRQVESLKTTVKRLEAELLAGKRREEASHTTAKHYRENMAASKLDVWRLKEKLKETTAQAERVAADHVRMKNEEIMTPGHKDDSNVDTASATDLERATAKTREMASRLQLAEKQVEQLQDILQETTAKLMDSQSVATSLKLSSERVVSEMVPKEELAKARTSESEAAKLLEEALTRCTKTEERLAQACDESLSLQKALREAEDDRDAKSKEGGSRDTIPFLAKESIDATSQTLETNQQYCDRDQSLLRLNNNLELTRVDLDASKKRNADLQQQLADSMAETNRATQEARRNNELALARQEEITNVSEREQAVLGELRQVHVNLKDAEKGRESALADGEQAKNRFAGAENSWRREVDDLKVALKEALAKNYGKDEGTELARMDGGVLEQSETASGEQAPPPPRPERAVTGGAVMTNEDPQPSTSVVSDATSEGLAEDLLQKLMDETKQRRSTRQASSDKASRLWTKKLNEERRMLALAKEAVKHHKERVKKRQERLLRCQARWRDQRQLSESSRPTNVRPRHTTRQRSLEDAKRQLLDGEVYKLNRFVKQLRSSKLWLAQRERKISDFEALLGADASSVESRPEQDTSTAAIPGVDSSSPESNSSSISTATLRSLKAMQQELDNDFSDFTAGSSIAGINHSRAVRGDRKSARAQRYASKRGKENALPESCPMFPTKYPPYLRFPPASRFWGDPPSHPYLGEHPQSRGIPSRSRASRPQHTVYRQDHGLDSGVQATVDDVRECSESDLQRWLNRPELNDTRYEIRSGVAARERREHFAKLNVEGRQARSTVALHVDWLNTLREEMGLLGFHSPKPSKVEPIMGISAAADTSASPRRDATAMEVQHAQDV